MRSFHSNKFKNFIFVLFASSLYVISFIFFDQINIELNFYIKKIYIIDKIYLILAIIFLISYLSLWLYIVISFDYFFSFVIFLALTSIKTYVASLIINSNTPDFYNILGIILIISGLSLNLSSANDEKNTSK